MKTKNLFLLMGIAIFAACAEDEIAPTYVDDGKSIKIEVTDEFAEAATRADYTGFPATTFEEGDAIGVYAFNGSTYVSSNIQFTRQANGSWTPSGTCIYNPDYTYYAYFPYRATAYTPSTSGTLDAIDTKFANFISDGNSYFWQANQSTKANFTASNLMIAKGVVTGTKTIKFTMQHKRGLAIVSPAVNQWYYASNSGTKYNLTPVFSGNIPYDIDGTKYFLLKPNTATSVAGLSLRASAGKYMISNGVEMKGTSVTYTYSTNGGSSFSSTKPSWLPVPTVVSGEGEPTMFSVAPDNSKTTNTVVSSGTILASNALSGKSTVSNVDLSMVDNAGNARESRTTANCYLVHNPGTYKIPLVYGNAIKDGETNSDAYHATSSGSYIKPDLVNHADNAITDPWIKTVIGGSPTFGAQLVWQDVSGMITAVGIDGDYLTFTVAGTSAGNAVVAATVGGVIVWSWHIWVTDETLSTTTAVAASPTYDVAAVNVGWVSDKVQTEYQGSSCVVRAACNGVTLDFTVQQPNNITATYSNGRNPYYQWGRKDPEIPMNLYTNYNCNTYDISGNAITTTSGNTIAVVSGAYSIGTTIQNPIKHYYNSSNYGPYNESYYNYWDMNQNGTGAITTYTEKTVYDPCPPGYCVPTGQLYNWMNSKTSTWTSTSNQQGRMLTYNSYNIFFPASGFRGNSSSQLYYGGSSGNYWSASAYSSNFGQYMDCNSSYFYWNYYNRASGFSVRPVLEK